MIRPDPSPGPPAELIEHWQLTPDGPPMQGYMAAVWPVRGPAGQRWVVKVTDAHHPPTQEGAALRAWAAAGPSRARIVRLVDQRGDALLLQRLDPQRSLGAHRDKETADRVLTECLVALRGVTAPATVPATVDELVRVQQAVQGHLHRHAGVGACPVPRRQVDAALATLEDLTRDPSLRGDRTLVHFDLHYDNILRDLHDSRWVVIDPLPHAGLPEIEVVPALRNRWPDILAAGDVDAALRRRLAMLAEAAALDHERARAIAQAVAVDNLLWLLPDRADDRFVQPYQVLASWV